MRKRQDRSGFTLIELLVVIAIIAVLISILLPSLKLARDQAKQVLCNTNLRAMGEAAEFYRAEYDDWFVRHNDDDYHVNFASSFMINLKPSKRVEQWNGQVLNLWSRSAFLLISVIKEVPQFQCPSHPDPDQPLDYVVSGFPYPYTRDHHRDDIQYGPFNPDGGPSGSFGEHWVNIFKLNGQYLDAHRPRNPHRILNSPVNFRLADLIYVTEGHVKHSTTQLHLHDVFYTSHLPLGAFPRIANDKRHPGGINSLFFDGHAVTMSIPRMDAGWGKDIGVRLRWFAPTVEEF